MFRAFSRLASHGSSVHRVCAFVQADRGLGTAGTMAPKTRKAAKAKNEDLQQEVSVVSRPSLLAVYV